MLFKRRFGWHIQYEIDFKKVDGANVGVHFEEEWNPIIQKRSGVLETSEKDQYNVFRNWVFEHLEDLWQILKTDYVLFGEVIRFATQQIPKFSSGSGANMVSFMIGCLISLWHSIFWKKKLGNLCPHLD